VGVGRNRDIAADPRSWDTPTFLIVASDWERKNGARVLAAFEQVRQTHPDARLHVVGRHPRIEQAGVETHGFLSMGDESDRRKLDQLFAQATCYVMPSLHEPLGIAHAEAGAAGIPSIGTERGGAREVIGDGGAVVDPTDLGQLVDAMRRFSNPTEAAAAGQRAQTQAQLYTWPRVAKRLLNAMGLLDPHDDPDAKFIAEGG
jgi:glycosyltransferase involved in cell wall biosynthesis